MSINDCIGIVDPAVQYPSIEHCVPLLLSYRHQHPPASPYRARSAKKFSMKHHGLYLSLYRKSSWRISTRRLLVVIGQETLMFSVLRHLCKAPKVLRINWLRLDQRQVLQNQVINPCKVIGAVQSKTTEIFTVSPSSPPTSPKCRI